MPDLELLTFTTRMLHQRSPEALLWRFLSVPIVLFFLPWEV